MHSNISQEIGVYTYRNNSSISSTKMWGVTHTKAGICEHPINMEFTRGAKVFQALKEYCC